LKSLPPTEIASERVAPSKVIHPSNGQKRPRPLFLIARRELVDAARSRWLFIFGLIFLALALAISYMGIGGAGYQSFARVTVSLLNLVLVVIPLMALLLGITSMTGHKESLEVLLSQPILRREALLGKYIGLAVALNVALFGGFGGAGLLITFGLGPYGLDSFLLLILLSFVLTLIFLSFAALLSVLFFDRARALGVGLLLWFTFLILYDFVVVGILTASSGIPMKTFLLTALLLNPIDAIRVALLISLGAGALIGPTGAVVAKTFGSLGGGLILAASLLFWWIVPLLGALFLFDRKDL